MIPVSLTIKGLYSYQNEQVIDFTKLTEAQLFGIFGTVGSGKSSILEAISFALYGETERLNTGDSRNYNMLNLKSNELLIDFIFLNHDNFKYRFVVNARRNGKNFDKVGTYSRSAYRFEGIWQPLETTKAEAIIGLSYVNFRRTIIIPQGQFQEFLQLTDSARTEMLKSIFHLDKFDFSDQVSSLFRKNEEKMHVLQGRLSQLGEVTEEILSEKVALVAILNQKHESVKTTFEVLRKSEADMTALKKQFEERERKIKVVASLEQQRETIETLKQKMSRYEYALLHFKDLLQREKECFQSQNKKKTELATVAERLTKIQEELKHDSTRFETIAQEFERLDFFQKEKTDYENLLSIHEKNNIYQKKKALLEKIHAELIRLESTKSELEKQVNDQKSAIESLKNELAQFTDWANVQGWYVKQEALEKQSVELQESFQSISLKIESKTASVPDLIPRSWQSADHFVNCKSSDDYKSVLEHLETENQTASDQLQRQLETLQVQVQLSAYASQIHEGAPCPLCGSHEHPEVLHIESVSQEITLVKEQKTALDQFAKEIQQTIKLLDVATAELGSLYQQRSETQEKIKLRESEIRDHVKLFVWKQFSPQSKNVFLQAQKKASENQEQLRVMEQAFKTIDDTWTASKTRYEAGKSHLNTNETDIKILESELSRLKQLIQTLGEAAFLLDSDTVHEKLKTTIQHINKTSVDYKTLFDKIQKNQIALVTVETEKLGMEKTYLELSNDLKTLQNRFRNQLEESTFSSREEVEQTLGDTMNLEACRNQVSTFEQELFSFRQSLKILDETLTGLTFDENAFMTLQMQVMEKKIEVERVNKELIEGQTLLKNLESQWEAKKGFQSEFSLIENRKENLKTMLNLFKSNGFVNYISSVYLQQLCEAANERFHKMTRQQLRLEVTENNTFQVRDYLNEGRVRSVKTLSGGQTFQASLCLALALAESIPQQSKAQQNFFFLDEGFGSQDKESLRFVFESLKALRQENRIVGIISHVEELQQEIDSYLSITNDPEHGSLVRASWTNS